jgi:hypothetical protein
MVTLPLRSDLPMATLSAMYLTNTITECIKSANANRLPPYTMIVCDIEPRPYLMYLFRCGLVAAFAAHRNEAHAHCSMLTSFVMLAYKMAHVNVLQAEFQKYGVQRAELTRSITELTPAGNQPAESAEAPPPSSAAAPPAAAPVAAAPVAAAPAPAKAAPAPPAPAKAGFGFVTTRNPPSVVAPVLSNVPAAQAAAVVRGVCPGCKANVMSDDDGRSREGDTYYHEQCIKGMCGGCGLIVHADSARVRRGAEYWHTDCV